MRRLFFLFLWFSSLLLAEQRHPLRTPVDRRFWRLRNNTTVGLISALFLCLAEIPASRMAAKVTERTRNGVLQWLRLPPWMEAALSFLLLDYSIYVWHVLLHRHPVLWRFHIAHHTDRDLDVSTTLRFHAGEIFFSTLWRTSTIILLGIKTTYLRVWESFLMSAILFQHSNIKLPLSFERCLNRLLVTPRMHGIHHSLIEQETNANWSSGLTIWDLLHGTLKLNVHQDVICVGVPAYRTTESVDLIHTLKLPFGKQRYAWTFASGKRPQRFLESKEESKLSLQT